MNQDEAQLKQTVAQAQAVLNQTAPDFELVNAINAVQQHIQNVESYQAFVAHH